MKPKTMLLKDFNSGKQRGPFCVAIPICHAEGAIPNGARIYKTNSKPGDGTQDGQMGTVISSLSDAVTLDPRTASDICYFVHWDHSPGLPVAIIGARIKPLMEDEA